MVDTRKTILVVEDHLDSAELLILLLSSLDYVTLLAHSRDAALKIIESHGEPDCIVMDWFMPGLTLPAFMETLRKNHPNVPVLAVSAAPQLAEKAKQMKIDRYLPKPYTPEELAAEISACIELRKKNP